MEYFVWAILCFLSLNLLIMGSRLIKICFVFELFKDNVGTIQGGLKNSGQVIQILKMNFAPKELDITTFWGF